MPLIASSKVQALIKQRLATGRYASEEDVLQHALQRLARDELLLDELHAAADDEVAGRVTDLEDFDRQIRIQRGWT